MSGDPEQHGELGGGGVVVNSSLVTGDPEQHGELGGGGVVVNSSLVTQRGGVQLLWNSNSILKTMRKSSGPHCLQCRG